FRHPGRASRELAGPALTRARDWTSPRRPERRSTGPIRQCAADLRSGSVVTSEVIDRWQRRRDRDYARPIGPNGSPLINQERATVTTTNPESVSTSTATRPDPPAVVASRGTLLVVLTGVFMTTLDFFIVNVAIPSTQKDLNASAAAIQWFVAGFGLAYGVGLITGGRLGDLYGRRRMFSVGLILFTLASLACGVAPTAGFLVGARVAQG